MRLQLTRPAHSARFSDKRLPALIRNVSALSGLADEVSAVRSATTVGLGATGIEVAGLAGLPINSARSTSGISTAVAVSSISRDGQSSVALTSRPCVDIWLSTELSDAVHAR